MKGYFNFKGMVALAIGSLALLGFSGQYDERNFIRENMEQAGRQLKQMLQSVPKPLAFPRTTRNEGELVTTSMYDWTPGFFPGNLWYGYEYTKDAELRKAALEWTMKLEPLQYFKDHHDLGFMMYCSFGNAYRLTGNPTFRDYLVQGARSLMTRFDPAVGVIKSWNVFRSWHGNRSYNYPVIIDNLMNLELLFFATRVSGDSSFYKTAVTHANNTLEYQVRPDYSTYHVVCYDSATGKPVGRETGQGYADNSTWARGQAWAVYGYTMIYRETRDPRYLKAAIGLADWYLQHPRLPEDKVPYWDFNALQEGYTPGIRSHANQVKTLYRDASAAAITASALLELCHYAGAKGGAYKDAAVKMLHSLSGPAYRATSGTNGNFLLRHSVGSIPHKAEIDVPLVYADYYYLEALLRYDRLLKGEPGFTAAKF